MKKLIVLCSLLLLTACQNVDEETLNTKTNNITEDVIKIGWFGPITGDMASYGEMAQDTVRLRFEQINQAGGIDGKKVELIWEDAKCNPKDGSLAVQKLVSVDKVKTIFGSCSGSVLSAIPITEKNEVMLLTAFATTPQFSGAGKYTFRTVPSDSSQGKVLADYANQHFDRVGVAVELTDYAIGVADTFEKHFKGEVVREEFMTSESSFKDRITKLKNADVQTLVLIPQSPPKFDIWAKQLTEQNWDKHFMGSEILASDQEIVTRHKAFLQDRKTIAANFIVPESAQVQQLMADYQDRYGRTVRFENYAAAHVDLINVYKDVVERVGDARDVKALREGFLNLEPREGMIGTISFNEEGDVNFGHSLLKFDGEIFVLNSN